MICHIMGVWITCVQRNTLKCTQTHLYNGLALGDAGGSVQVLEMSRFSGSSVIRTAGKGWRARYQQQDCWVALASPSPIPSPILIRTAGEGWTARSLQLFLGLFSQSPLGGRSPDYSEYSDSDYSDCDHVVFENIYDQQRPKGAFMSKT